MSDLRSFFRAMTPFLQGTSSLKALGEALGPSASGERRLAFYRDLVAADARRILEDAYPSVRHAAALEGLSFCRLAADYRRAHPADHWHQHRFGRALPEFLRTRRLPPWFEELADFHRARFEAATCLDAAGAQRLDRTLFVRRYAHDLLPFVRAVEAADPWSRPTLPPAARSTIVVVYRSLRDGRPYAYSPPVAELLALGARFGVPRLDGDVTPARLDAAHASLVHRGVFDEDACGAPAPQETHA